MAVRPDQMEASSRASPPEPAPPHGASVGAAEVERQRAVLSFLRQLMSGLSAYRLFPGDVEQPSFVQACERIAGTAETLLQGGPVVLDIHGSQISIDHEPLPSDERVDRLALACYQHRAEQLTVSAVPSAADLAILFDGLSRPVGGGGVGSGLRVAGVTSISVVEFEPVALDPESPSLKPTPEQRSLWDLLGDPDRAANALVEHARNHPTAEAAAAAAFEHLKALIAKLPAAQANGFELYRRLQDVIPKLPRALRKALTRLLVERVREEPVAERLVGTMTDAGLARLLVELKGGPQTPVQLARRLWEAGVRRDDLIELTTALLSGHEEGGTIIAGVEKVVPEAIAAQMLAPARTDPSSPVARTVSSFLARGLVDMGQDDVRSIREGYPAAPDQIRTVAFDALADYLLVESDMARFGEVLAMWVRETGDALRRRDAVRVGHLLQAVAGVADAGTDKRLLAEVSMKRVIDQHALLELVSPQDGDAEMEATVVILREFGGLAVEALLDDLASERDRGRRAMLLAVLGQVARGHHHRVAKRLSDHRWYVARNAVSILQRLEEPEAVPFLVQAMQHDAAPVRREAVRAVVAAAGEASLADLMRRIEDPDSSVRTALISSLGGVADPWVCAPLGRVAVALTEPPERRLAVEALAHHPSPQALAELDRLVTDRTKPRLPRRIRSHARAMLRSRREVAG